MNIKNFLQTVIKRSLGINTPGFTEYFAFGGGVGTASGQRVNESNALAISAVYECVRVISDTVASLPLFLYESTATGKLQATDHPLYSVLHTAPNPLMTPATFKRTMQGHLCLWGNAFAQVIRNGGGEVIELWPLRPDRMRLQDFSGKLFYYYTFPNGSERQLREVLHLRGLSDDGLIGYSPITLQREKLGLTKASEEYRARFFRNDARPGGVLNLAAGSKLSRETHERLRNEWAEHYGGENRRKPAILEYGMTWQDIGVNPDDAQFIEGEEFGKADIAAIFRVPAYKIGLMKPGTVSYASVEQQAIDWVVDGVMPWNVAWEEQINLTLLTPIERRRYFAKFSLNALLRGDSAQRADFYTKMFNIGVFSQNEIRELEDQNTIGKLGDRRYVPLNMVPVDLVDKLMESKTQPKDPTIDVTPGAGEPAKLNGVAH